MIKLIQQADGTYEYVDAATTAPTNSNLSTLNTALDAYEGNTNKSVVDSSVASQTQKVMRETPGQYSTNFDPKTGQFSTSSTAGGREEIAFQEPERTPDGTGQTALQKVMSLSQTAGSQSTEGLDKAYKLIEDQQKLAKRAELTSNLFKGADFALNTYKAIKGDSVLNIASSQSNIMTPITQIGKMPVGASTIGGVGTAGALGYGVSKLLGGDAKENKASGVGSAIGMAVGGPVGGVVGGIIGRVFGCFLPDTQITMKNGLTKSIIDINLNDDIAIGGRVFAHAKFLVSDLYDYKGIKVSGSHMVNENNKWLRVEESKLSKSLGSKEHTVYTLGTDNRRILINNILFTDYFEVDEKEELQIQGDEYFNNWKNHSIELQDHNKNILNAI